MDIKSQIQMNAKFSWCFENLKMRIFLMKESRKRIKASIGF